VPPLHHTFVRLLRLVWIVLSVLCGAAAPQAPPSPPSLDEVRARAGAWVAAFEKNFSTVVAEERYVQLIKPWFGVPRSAKDEPELAWSDDPRHMLPNRPNAPIERRQLRSDVLLVQAPGGRWMCYRDVFEVAGRPVRNREDRVRRLFLSQSADDRAQLKRIADEGARYNLGGLLRNFNVPTFPLLMAHPRHQPRATFSRRGDESIEGVAYWVVAFKESRAPMLVRTPKGVEVPMVGQLWIHPATGRIARARVDIDDRTVNLRSVIQTDFRDDPELGAVPHVMWEWYRTTAPRVSGGVAALDEYVECLASYANFRRFQVTTQEGIR
jgi:hypothetical protein